MEANDNQLRRMVNAMQVMGNTVNSENPHIMITHLVDATRLFATRSLGFSSRFDDLDKELCERVGHVSKSDDVISIDDTVQSVWERDVARPQPVDCLSRCIVRLMRIIQVLAIIFEEFLSNPKIDSFEEPMSVAYKKVWAPFHGPIWKDYYDSLLPDAPSLSHVQNTLNEDENSMNDLFRRFVEASKVVINYYETLLRSNEISARYLRLI